MSFVTIRQLPEVIKLATSVIQRNHFRLVPSSRFNEEIRNRIYLQFKHLRDPEQVNLSFQGMVNTPEFSRFVFGVPFAFLLGMTALSLAPPSTSPLVFERLIPYHVKTVVIACAFFSWIDVARLGLAHRTLSASVGIYGIGSLLGATAMLAHADTNAKSGYMWLIPFTIAHAVPLWWLPMPGWLKSLRCLFLATSVVSTVAAQQRIKYLESNWMSVVLVVMNSADSFQPFHNTNPSGTIRDWATASVEGWQRLQRKLVANEAFSDAENLEDQLLPDRLDSLTLAELVDVEIDRVVAGEILKPRPIDAIRVQLEAGACAASTLQTTKLMQESTYPETLKVLQHDKFNLPMQNSISQPSVISGFREGKNSSTILPTVSVQVYKEINLRETKLLEIDFSIDATIFDLFKFITNQLPSSKMFDGPLYAGYGLVVVNDKQMYIANESEDYSTPYLDWLDSAKNTVNVSRMDSCSIGELPLDVCINNIPLFILFNGDESLRTYFSNIKLTDVNLTELPRITYRRKIPRIVRCVLCKTRAADLVVLNDIELPLNPSHCCGNCYRRFRSDRTGSFVDPPDYVIVSNFGQI